MKNMLLAVTMVGILFVNASAFANDRPTTEQRHAELEMIATHNEFKHQVSSIDASPLTGVCRAAHQDLLDMLEGFELYRDFNFFDLNRALNEVEQTLGDLGRYNCLEAVQLQLLNSKLTTLKAAYSKHSQASPASMTNLSNIFS